MTPQVWVQRTAKLLARSLRGLFVDDADTDFLEPCPYCNTWGPWQARVCNHCGAILMSASPWKEFFRDDAT